MNFTTDLIFQVIVGCGMIAGMWRLTREVASLATTMRFYAERTDDHETRIRVLEEHAHEQPARVR